MDLTPRAAPTVRRRRRAPSTVMLSVVLVAVAFLLFKFLTKRHDVLL